ncbi:MAG: DUF2851 family protein [Bacteroidales bacterium]|nr:DUF2851 family protein [Bacteroidales bacterium]
MTEQLLQFLWSSAYLPENNFITTSGQTIEVVSFGKINSNSGPDFVDAKVKINDTLWCGTVEMHLKSSDWFKHQHQTNKEYNTVILHVVTENDVAVKRHTGEEIPTLILKIPDELIKNYDTLKSKNKINNCYSFISENDTFYFKSYLYHLLITRLERKSNDIALLFNKQNQNWEKTLYQYLAKHFGFKINAYPFEKLAESIPLENFAKIKNSLIQIEALLFGQSGFLSNDLTCEYALKLKKEYQHLQKMLTTITSPIEPSLWKHLRLRPQNFPEMRIAQFAGLIYHSKHLFSKILEVQNIDELRKLLNLETSEYWQNHFRLDGNYKIRKTSNNSSMNSIAKDLLIINGILPVLFYYGQKTDNQNYIQKAIDLLESMSAEKNSIISKWEEVGFKPKCAHESQALLELYNEYCLPGFCLKCRIGKKYIMKKIETENNTI